MGQIIEFPVQLELPLWWAVPDKFMDYTDDETVSRPTETSAIQRIYRQAKALHNTHYRTVLTPLEKQLLDLELFCLRRNPHFSTEQRLCWIAAKVKGLAPFQVKAYLDEVTQVQREWVSMEESERRCIAQYRKTRRLQQEYRQLVFEVLLEEAA